MDHPIDFAGLELSVLDSSGYSSLEAGFTGPTWNEFLAEGHTSFEHLGGYVSTASGDGIGMAAGLDLVSGTHESDSFEGESHTASVITPWATATVSDPVEDGSGQREWSLAGIEGSSGSTGLSDGLGYAEADAMTHHYTVADLIRDVSELTDDSDDLPDKQSDDLKQDGDSAPATEPDVASHPSDADGGSPAAQTLPQLSMDGPTCEPESGPSGGPDGSAALPQLMIDGPMCEPASCPGDGSDGTERLPQSMIDGPMCEPDSSPSDGHFGSWHGEAGD